MPESYISTLFIHTMGAGVLAVASGRLLTDYFGLWPPLAALVVMGAISLLAWLGNFPIMAALGMGVGSGLLALADIYINLNNRDTILSAEGLALAAGLFLFVRSFSVGPNPNGWPRVEE